MKLVLFSSLNTGITSYQALNPLEYGIYTYGMTEQFLDKIIWEKPDDLVNIYIINILNSNF